MWRYVMNMEEQMKKKILCPSMGMVAAFTLFVVFAVNGFCEEKQPSLEEVFKAMDTNGDGGITKDEGPAVYNWPQGRFEIKDLNDDGKITLLEFKTWRNAPRTKKLANELSDKTFTALDFDGDGYIRTDEWFGTAESFKKKDLNKDGYISKEEIRKTHKKKKL